MPWDHVFTSVPVVPRPPCSTLMIPSAMQTCLRETQTLAELLPLKTHRRGSWWARQGPLWWRRHWVRSWRQLWWWPCGSAPEVAVDGGTGPWAVVYPDPRPPHTVHFHQKGFVSKKPTFTRLVSPFFFKLEARKSPSHLRTHHQLDKKKKRGENRTQRTTRGLEKMIERPCLKKKQDKRENKEK